MLRMFQQIEIKHLMIKELLTVWLLINTATNATAAEAASFFPSMLIRILNLLIKAAVKIP